MREKFNNLKGTQRQSLTVCAVGSDKIIHDDGVFHVLVTVMLNKVRRDTVFLLLEAHKLGSELGYDAIFGEMLPEYPFSAVLRDDDWVSLYIYRLATDAS